MAPQFQPCTLDATLCLDAANGSHPDGKGAGLILRLALQDVGPGPAGPSPPTSALAVKASSCKASMDASRGMPAAAGGPQTPLPPIPALTTATAAAMLSGAPEQAVVTMDAVIKHSLDKLPGSVSVLDWDG